MRDEIGADGGGAGDGGEEGGGGVKRLEGEGGRRSR